MCQKSWTWRSNAARRHGFADGRRAPVSPIRISTRDSRWKESRRSEGVCDSAGAIPSWQIGKELKSRLDAHDAAIVEIPHRVMDIFDRTPEPEPPRWPTGLPEPPDRAEDRRATGGQMAVKVPAKGGPTRVTTPSSPLWPNRQSPMQCAGDPEFKAVEKEITIN